jgi:hypothetical protein
MLLKNEEAGKAVATAIPSLNTKADRRQLASNPTARRDQDFCDAILTCWRWARSLDHRLDVYRLQFEHDVAGALDTNHHALANEISSFRTIAHGLAG